MEQINETTVVVLTFLELKEALEKENGYTYVYLGADISFPTNSSGILIHKTKKEVTIDGTYNEIRHTYTDKKSTTATDTLYINNKDNERVLVKNMDIIGNNYYGVVYVPESTTYSHVVLEFDHVTYTGVQMTFHPSGLTRYLDCTITVQDGYVSGGEVAECNQIELGGKTTILHKSTANTMFWYRGSLTPSFKVLQQADVKLTSENRELFYGTDSLSFSVSTKAKLVLNSKNGMGYGTYGCKDILLDKMCEVEIVQTGVNGSYPTCYCSGSFVVEEGANLTMVRSSASMNTSCYCLYFRSTSASFTLHNPNKVLFYDKTARCIYTNSEIPFTFTFSRINLWENTTDYQESGTILDLPTYAWYKENTTSRIEGKFSSSKTTISSTSFSEEELKSLPSLDSFALQKTKVLSIGKMILGIDPILEGDLQVTGLTLPNASLLLILNEEKHYITAGEDGRFQYDLEAPLPDLEILSFVATVNQSYIYQNKNVQVVYPGELSILDASKTIVFSLEKKIENQLFLRSTELSVVVLDSRKESSNWKLYASIEKDLSHNDKVLSHSLVYKKEDSIQTLTTTPILVYEGVNNEGITKTTTVSFLDEEGILLDLSNNFLEANALYETEVIWSIEE